MKPLIFFLEEPSAKEMLKAVLPKILPDHVHPEFKVFEGKQDLEKGLPRILRAWRVLDCDFVVIRDQDSGDCHAVKQNLIAICQKARREDVLIRVACRELESFYLGDLAAVEKGFGIPGLERKQNSRKYRNPDRLSSPSRELDRLTSVLYQKISGSRAIAPHLSLESNASHSFRILNGGHPQAIGECAVNPITESAGIAGKLRLLSIKGALRPETFLRSHELHMLISS